MRAMAATFVFMFAWTAFLRAGAPEFAPAVKEITAFKDGHALIRAEGEAKLEDGWCRLQEVPAPLLGMFWAYSLDAGASVDLVRAGKEDWSTDRPCLTLDEMLKANAGRKVRIEEQLPAQAPAVTTGTLLPMAEQAGPGGAAVSPQASFIAVRTDPDCGIRLIRRENVINLSIMDGNPTTLCASTESRRTLALHAVDAKGRPLKEARLGILYLQKGLRWIPGYRIDLQDGGAAHIALTAELVNDLIDFSGADLKLVVGVPNFLMKDTLSPLSLREGDLQLSSYLNPPASGGRVNAFSNQLMSQAAMPAGELRATAEEGFSVPDEGQREDLFIYKKAGISMRKGDRALVPLADAETAYEDLYAWEIPPVPPKEAWQSINQGGPQGALSPMTGTQALHKIRLTNPGPTPWTTAPASLFKGGAPLAQQLLAYTPPKNDAEITVTTATDLNTKRLETETGRQPNIRFNGDDYIRVAMKGALTVTNFKDKGVRVKIARKIIGDARNAKVDGKVTQSNALEDTALGLGLYPWSSWNWPWWLWSANPVSVVSWEVEVPAGKPVTVEYEYSYLFHPY